MLLFINLDPCILLKFKKHLERDELSNCPLSISCKKCKTIKIT